MLVALFGLKQHVPVVVVSSISVTGQRKPLGVRKGEGCKYGSPPWISMKIAGYQVFNTYLDIYQIEGETATSHCNSEHFRAENAIPKPRFRWDRIFGVFMKKK